MIDEHVLTQYNDAFQPKKPKHTFLETLCIFIDKDTDSLKDSQSLIEPEPNGGFD